MGRPNEWSEDAAKFETTVWEHQFLARRQNGRRASRPVSMFWNLTRCTGLSGWLWSTSNHQKYSLYCQKQNSRRVVVRRSNCPLTLPPTCLLLCCRGSETWRHWRWKQRQCCCPPWRCRRYPTSDKISSRLQAYLRHLWSPLPQREPSWALLLQIAAAVSVSVEVDCCKSEGMLRIIIARESAGEARRTTFVSSQHVRKANGIVNFWLHKTEVDRRPGSQTMMGVYRSKFLPFHWLFRNRWRNKINSRGLTPQVGGSM